MSYQLLTGDNRTVMRMLADKSVHCIVTSPPYFNLRLYSGEQDVDWPAFEYSPMPGLPPLSIPAWRGGLGNEPTIEMYIGHLVLCLREWWRVLRDDGCCFVNLGDSYAANRSYQVADSKWCGVGNSQGSKVPNGLKPKDLCLVPARFTLAAQADGWHVRSRIIWAKGVSFLADYAGSCMPESVTDRPTKSDEDIYLLTKQPKYFWDQEAVKEKGSNRDPGNKTHKLENATGTVLGRKENPHGGLISMGASSGRSLRSVWVINPQGYDGAHFAVWPPALVAPMIKAATSEHGVCANCGSPWQRVVQRTDQPDTSAKGSRFDKGKTGVNGNGRVQQGERYMTQAVGWQPTCTCNLECVNYAADDMDIIETPTGERVADDPTMHTGRKGMNRPRGENEGRRLITRYEQRRYAVQLRNSTYREHMEHEAGNAFAHYIRTDSNGARPVPPELLESWISNGWIDRVTIPSFTPHPIVPAIVLDPFNGSGTSGAVACALGRDYIGIDLSADYIELAHARIAAAIRDSGRAYVPPKCKAADFADMPLFAEVP